MLHTLPRTLLLPPTPPFPPPHPHGPPPTPRAVAQTILRAAEAYATPAYATMRDRCISQDLSWVEPAKKWEAVLAGEGAGRGAVCAHAWLPRPRLPSTPAHTHPSAPPPHPPPPELKYGPGPTPEATYVKNAVSTPKQKIEDPGKPSPSA